MKALIVEDSRSIKMVLTDALQPLGLTAVLADNGLLALEALKDTSEFKVIITDLNMPEMDGRQLISSIRASEKHRNTPIIVLSGRGTAQDIEAIKKLQIQGWIVKKQFDRARLQKLVRSLL